MGDVAIRVEGLGKQYRLGAAGVRYSTLRDQLRRFASIQRLLRRTENRPTFWALKNVSFEVRPGEVVGIIGRNGAGKSTLLKILSQITEPTEGGADILGRVGSLLEVGTGFHPELSGRENIYLNGAILGMRRAEIARKFDEIVAFAEVERFIDTPVKHYSSGMSTRLAFAVAAHLEPEILVVDEVLAVGDAEFQKKCLGKMNSAAQAGRTVLFVSHDLVAVRSLCTTGIVLAQGTVEKQGPIGECVQHYVRQRAVGGDTGVRDLSKPAGAKFWMTRIGLLVNGQPASEMYIGDRLGLEVTYSGELVVPHPRVGYVISTAAGERLLCANNHFQPATDPPTAGHTGVVRCDLGVVPLMLGHYTVSLWFGDPSEDTHAAPDAVAFEVLPGDPWGTGRQPPQGVSHLWWPTRFECRAEANE